MKKQHLSSIYKSIKYIILLSVLNTIATSCTSNKNDDENHQVVQEQNSSIRIGSISIDTVLYNSINIDSLIECHKDSSLFMGYWSGMSKKDFGFVSYKYYLEGVVYDNPKKQLSSFGNISDHNLYTNLTFEGIDYPFIIEYEEDMVVLKNADYLPENSYLKRVINIFEDKYKDTPYVLLEDYHSDDISGVKKTTQKYYLLENKAVHILSGFVPQADPKMSDYWLWVYYIPLKDVLYRYSQAQEKIEGENKEKATLDKI